MSWYDEALERALSEWETVVAAAGSWELLVEEDTELAVLDARADGLVRSTWETGEGRVVAFKRLLWAHSLAKVTRPEIDSRALRDGGGQSGQGWTARTFAESVLVRFRDSLGLQSVFGKTPNVYNTGFLLKAHRLEPDMQNVLYPQAISDTCDLLDWIDEEPAIAPRRARTVFVRLLCLVQEAVVSAGAGASSDVTSDSKQVLRAITAALQSHSGGEFHMTLVALALEQRGFDKVERLHRNVAGTVGGQLARVGDIQCLRAGKVAVAAEVKARSLQLDDLESSLSELEEFSGTFLIFCEGLDAHADIENRLAKANTELASDVLLIENATRWVLAEFGLLTPPELLRMSPRVAEMLAEHAGAQFASDWWKLLKEST